MTAFETSLYKGLEEVSEEVQSQKKILEAFIGRMIAFRSELWIIHLRSSTIQHNLTEAFVNEFNLKTDELVELWGGAIGVWWAHLKVDSVIVDTEISLLHWIQKVLNHLDEIQAITNRPADILPAIEDMRRSILLLKSHTLRS